HIPGFWVNTVVRLRRLGERLTGRVAVLDAVLVVKVEAAFLHRDQEKAGVTMPAGTPARRRNKVVQIELCLPLVVQIDRPIVADADVSLARIGRGTLSEDDV